MALRVVKLCVVAVVIEGVCLAKRPLDASVLKHPVYTYLRAWRKACVSTVVLPLPLTSASHSPAGSTRLAFPQISLGGCR